MTDPRNFFMAGFDGNHPNHNFSCPKRKKSKKKKEQKPLQALISILQPQQPVPADYLL
jgi:hypothetical protein